MDVPGQHGQQRLHPNRGASGDGEGELLALVQPVWGGQLRQPGLGEPPLSPPLEQGGSQRHHVHLYPLRVRQPYRLLSLTKRGAAAQQYFRDLCSIPAKDIEVGMKVWIEPGPFNTGGYSEVTGIEAGRTRDSEGQPGLRITTKKMALYTFRSSMYRVKQTKEARAEKVAKAMAYQDSLTKAGKPRKRPLKKGDSND